MHVNMHGATCMVQHAWCNQCKYLQRQHAWGNMHCSHLNLLRFSPQANKHTRANKADQTQASKQASQEANIQKIDAKIAALLASCPYVRGPLFCRSVILSFYLDGSLAPCLCACLPFCRLAFWHSALMPFSLPCCSSALSAPLPFTRPTGKMLDTICVRYG